MWIKSKPKSINILGVVMPIRYHSEPFDGNVGTFSSEPFQIDIYDNEDWSYHLLHEVIHAAFYLSGYNGFFPMKVEEGICRVVELAVKTALENIPPKP